MAAEGVRVYVLAKELGVKITEVLAAGRSLGIPLRGLMSVIPADRREEVKEFLKPFTPSQVEAPKEGFAALFRAEVS
jgi:hypothetical protein